MLNYEINKRIAELQEEAAIKSYKIAKQLQELLDNGEEVYRGFSVNGIVRIDPSSDMPQDTYDRVSKIMEYDVVEWECDSKITQKALESELKQQRTHEQWMYGKKESDYATDYIQIREGYKWLYEDRYNYGKHLTDEDLKYITPDNFNVHIQINI